MTSANFRQQGKAGGEWMKYRHMRQQSDCTPRRNAPTEKRGVLDGDAVRTGVEKGNFHVRYC